MAYGVPIEILKRKKRVCVVNTIVPIQKGFSYSILILFLDALGFFIKFSLIEALFINDSNGIGTIFSLIKEEYTIYGRCWHRKSPLDCSRGKPSTHQCLGGCWFK